MITNLEKINNEWKKLGALSKIFTIFSVYAVTFFSFFQLLPLTILHIILFGIAILCINLFLTIKNNNLGIIFNINKNLIISLHIILILLLTAFFFKNNKKEGDRKIKILIVKFEEHSNGINNNFVLEKSIADSITKDNNYFNIILKEITQNFNIDSINNLLNNNKYDIVITGSKKSLFNTDEIQNININYSTKLYKDLIQSSFHNFNSESLDQIVLNNGNKFNKINGCINIILALLYTNNHNLIKAHNCLNKINILFVNEDIINLSCLITHNMTKLNSIYLIDVLNELQRKFTCLIDNNHYAKASIINMELSQLTDIFNSYGYDLASYKFIYDINFNILTDVIQSKDSSLQEEICKLKISYYGVNSITLIEDVKGFCYDNLQQNVYQCNQNNIYTYEARRIIQNNLLFMRDQLTENNMRSLDSLVELQTSVNESKVYIIYYLISQHYFIRNNFEKSFEYFEKAINSVNEEDKFLILYLRTDFDYFTISKCEYFLDDDLEKCEEVSLYDFYNNKESLSYMKRYYNYPNSITLERYSQLIKSFYFYLLTKNNKSRTRHHIDKNIYFEELLNESIKYNFEIPNRARLDSCFLVNIYDIASGYYLRSNRLKQANYYYEEFKKISTKINYKNGVVYPMNF